MKFSEEITREIRNGLEYFGDATFNSLVLRSIFRYCGSVASNIKATRDVFALVVLLVRFVHKYDTYSSIIIHRFQFVKLVSVCPVLLLLCLTGNALTHKYIYICWYTCYIRLWEKKCTFKSLWNVCTNDRTLQMRVIFQTLASAYYVRHLTYNSNYVYQRSLSWQFSYFSDNSSQYLNVI